MPRAEGRAGVRPPSQWLKYAYLSSAVDYLCVMWALVPRRPAGPSLARKMADEIAAEVGVTDEDLAWARSVLGVDDDD